MRECEEKLLEPSYNDLSSIWAKVCAVLSELSSLCAFDSMLARHDCCGCQLFWSFTGSFLMLAAQEADHLRHQRRRCHLNAPEVHHLRFPPDLVYQLDMLIFALTYQWLHISLGREDRSRAILAGTSKSSTTCPIVEYSATEGFKPKSGHLIWSLFGS